MQLSQANQHSPRAVDPPPPVMTKLVVLPHYSSPSPPLALLLISLTPSSQNLCLISHHLGLRHRFVLQHCA